MSKISDEDLLQDLTQVAIKLGKSPTSGEYTKHGSYGTNTLIRRFGKWNEAKIAAGLTRNRIYGASDQTLLKHLREKLANSQATSLDKFVKYELKYGYGCYRDRFGGVWVATVRAGSKPSRTVPLSEADYDSYIQAAINTKYPSVSLYALLRAFTGIPHYILMEFSLDWVSRLDSDLQPAMITIPSEYVVGNEDWVLLLPSYYTAGASEQKPTHLKPLLRWMKKSNMLIGPQAKGFLDTVIERANIDATPRNLRATVATHLARRGMSRWEIEMQVGAEKTNWKRSIEDYFLYLYQFENYCHPDYEPSGVYIDPQTGEPYTPNPEAD